MGKKKVKQLKPSKAYMTFEKMMERSLNLAELQKPVDAIVKAAGQQSNVNSSDVLRISLVLGVAAMDSYFTNVFAERFVTYLQKKGPNKNIVHLLEKAGLDIETTLKIMTMDRPYRRIRTLIENYLDNHVTQRSEVIDELFLSYHLKDFSENIEKLQNRRTLISSIRNAVTRRHQIVHEGDINSRGKLNSLTLKDIRRKLKDIVVFVAGADEILQKQL